MDNYLPDVRAQYEDLPYPPRDPEEERKRLVPTWLDSLPMISHYCFGGEWVFGDGFRVLVAGGGTGDGTIYLAEQLRDTNAEIVHCDLSSASMAIAQKRAEIRGLENIRWIHDSLLNLPTMDLGEFDYINCSGVLHHLEDPNAGFEALKSMLAPNGAMGIMVYAQYGRTGVYQMQELLKQINGENADINTKLENARQILEAAPPSNWFNKGTTSDHLTLGDAGIFDLLLHSQDRAYTVEELYQWLHDQHGFHIQFTDLNRGNAPYQPRLAMAPKRPPILNALDTLPLRKQQAIAELLSGSIDIHSFYLTPQAPNTASYGDPDMVPFFAHEPVTGPDISALIHRSPQPFVISHAHTGIRTELDTGSYGKFIFKYMDGKRSFGQIFELVRKEKKFKKMPPDDAKLFADFEPLYRFFNAIDRLLLRKES
ncbi:MAG: class I SAM-dependent methyltransferase [Gammaproteobacteria bacterium]